MNKNKFFAISIVILLITNLLLLGLLVFRRPPRPPFDGPKNEIVKSLNFDENQKEQFEKLIVVHKRKTKYLRQELDKSKSELYRSLTNINQSDLKTDSIFSKVAVINSKVEILNYNHFKDIKKICRKDQLNDFKELTSKMSQLFSPRPHPKK